MRPRSHRAPLRAPALLAAALATLAGCGDGTSPADRLSAAVRATEAERSAAISLEMHVDMGEHGPGAQVSVSGDGVVDLESETGRMEMSYPGLGGSLLTVYDGDAVYVRLPPALSGGDGERWVRRGADGPTGMIPGSSMGRNPLGMLDALDAVEGEIRPLGADTVGEVEVRGFAFTLTGRQLWREAPEGDGPPDALLGLEIPTEAWLDGSDRVRRMVVELDLGALADVVRETASDSVRQGMGALLGSVDGTLSVTTELDDFGTEVDVETPDEDDLVPEEELGAEPGGG